MKTDERRLIFHYLNNVLESRPPLEMQESLWNWAEHHDLELFQSDLAALWDRENVSPAGEAGRVLRGKRADKMREMKGKTALLRRLAAARRARTGRPASRLLENMAASFSLRAPERETLGLFVNAMRLPILNNLLDAVTDRSYGSDFSRRYFPLLGRLLGRPAGHLELSFRPESPLMANGLFVMDEDGDISTSAVFKKIVNNERAAARDMKSLILGPKGRPDLTRANFAHLGPVYDQLAKLLDRALARKTKGINLLFYGPPGTGKTELAKTLCAEAGADLYPVSETSEEGGQEARLSELRMAASLTQDDPRAVLLADEAEDILSGKKAEGHKLLFNRLLERNAAPVIWITNHVRRLDAAYLRRFAYALEVKTPPAPARALVWKRELARRGLKVAGPEIDKLARDFELPPAFAASAVKTVKLTGDKSLLRGVLNSLDYAMTGRRRAVREERQAGFSFDLLNTDADLARLTERVLASGPRRLSLCLFGAPGTGKSEYATYLAGRLGLEPLRKRGSDLFSMFVGGTEANIARAFEEARDERKFLIIDEADSFLRDRSGAERSWEVTQVNEMLTWMESHPYPFACTTNLMDSLDRASLRRFTWKVKYDYLRPEQARLAFRHFFGTDYDLRLSGLTPGDFAVVADKAGIMGLTDPAELARLLSLEQEAKGLKRGGLGFCAAL